MRIAAAVAAAAVATARPRACRGPPLATVYYTASAPVDLRALTTSRGAWPPEYGFFYYGDEALDASMRALDETLREAGVAGAREPRAELGLGDRAR